MKQVGKIGRINQKANKKIAQMWIDKDIHYCEACKIIWKIEGKLPGPACLQASSNAHRHGRVWYRSRPELLWAFEQVIRSCQYAHDYLDKNTKVREAVFLLLRGPEKL